MPRVHRRLQPEGPPPPRREGAAPLPAGQAAPGALEPARRDQGLLRRREGRPREAADDREGDGADRQPDDSRVGDRLAVDRLEPVHERGEGDDLARAGSPADPEGPAGVRVARVRHPLREAPLDLPRRPPRRPVLPVRAVAHRPALRRGPGASRGARAGDARGGPLLARLRRGRRAREDSAWAGRSSRSTSGTRGSATAGRTPKPSSTRSRGRGTPPRRRSRRTSRGSSATSASPRSGPARSRRASSSTRRAARGTPGARPAGATRPTCAPASARKGWTTRATTSPSTSSATTSSRRSR